MPRKRQQLPDVMSKGEAKRLFAQVRNPKQQVLLYAIYAAGLCLGEAVKLRCEDVQYASMRALRQLFFGANTYRMKIALILATLSIALQAPSQEIAKKCLLVGTELGIGVGTYKDWATGEKHRESAFRFGPQLGLFLTPRLVAGLSGEYGWHGSNYLEDVYPPHYGAGTFMRYYFDIKALDKPLGENRIRSYAGVTYHRTNYYHPRRGELEVGSRLDEQLIFISAGLNFRLLRQLYLEWSAKPEFYINRRARFTGRAGFEYHFSTKTDKR
jgi:hypothetical protein